jgi:parallel beta-helix repeat protein
MKKTQLAVVMCIFLFTLPSSVAGSYVDLTVSEAQTLIASTPSLMILDVRTLDEYNSGHIQYAANIPLDELDARLGELDPTSPLLVYCKLGGRSATASQLLVDNGFLHVYNMLSGISAWIDAGYPVYTKYASLQTAIDTSHTGETLFVARGVYSEHLNITKPLTLRGEHTETTIIDGEDGGTIIRIEAGGVTVAGFTLIRCGCPCGGNSGIYIAGSQSNVTVTHTLVTQNLGYGITVDRSRDVTLADNTLVGNLYGLRLLNSTQITVVANRILDSNNFGLYIGFSNDSLIHGNHIAGNSFGIGLFYSVNNTLYHNNLRDNAEPLYTYASSDTWDNGCEGNYWSTYTGEDLDGDGIGDTELPGEGVDSYPLMNEYWNPGDVDHDLDVDIFDAVRTASAYGSTPSDPNWNPHCDIASPYGVINIYDIVVLAGSYGQEHTD